MRQARAMQSFHSADDQIVIILCRLERKGFDPGKIPPFFKEMNFVIQALYRRLVKEENQREEQRPQTDMNNDMTSRAGEAAAATKQGNTTTKSPSFSSFFSRSDFEGGNPTEILLWMLDPLGRSAPCVRAVCLFKELLVWNNTEKPTVLFHRITRVRKNNNFLLLLLLGCVSRFFLFFKKRKFGLVHSIPTGLLLLSIPSFAICLVTVSSGQMLFLTAHTHPPLKSTCPVILLLLPSECNHPSPSSPWKTQFVLPLVHPFVQVCV